MNALLFITGLIIGVTLGFVCGALTAAGKVEDIVRERALDVAFREEAWRDGTDD